MGLIEGIDWHRDPADPSLGYFDDDPRGTCYPVEIFESLED